ncbi:MAG TPA: ROK family protein [Sphaerochaeta sp.]|nr:ROK family protein [Sphaerochaeta sp.]
MKKSMIDEELVSSAPITWFIGVDIGGTKTAVSIGCNDGTIKHKIKFSTKPIPMDVIEDIKVAIAGCLDRFPCEIAAIGISCGGPLDAKKGVIQAPPNLPNWIDIPIVDILHRAYAIPVFLQNDANASALAELHWGNGQGCENLIFLTFGTGMGAGLILDGKLYEGKNGLSGEVGHIRLAQEGAECYGKKGSFESFCSGNGLRKMFELHYGESLTGQQICALAEEGEPRASHIISLSAEYLGRGLAILIDIFNPDRIIIGSIFTRSESLFRETMEKYLKLEALDQSRASCEILPSKLKEELGDKAALCVALHAFSTREEIR